MEKRKSQALLQEETEKRARVRVWRWKKRSCSRTFCAFGPIRKRGFLKKSEEGKWKLWLVFWMAFMFIQKVIKETNRNMLIRKRGVPFFRWNLWKTRKIEKGRSGGYGSFVVLSGNDSENSDSEQILIGLRDYPDYPYSFWAFPNFGHFQLQLLG